MPSGSITAPSANGVAFPSSVTGTYNSGMVGGPGDDPPPCKVPLGLKVTMTVTKADDEDYTSEAPARLRCITDTTGTWSCPMPNDLVAGQSDYTITVVVDLNGATTTYTRTGITT